MGLATESTVIDNVSPSPSLVHRETLFHIEKPGADSGLPTSADTKAPRWMHVDDSIEDLPSGRPFFIKIGKDGVLSALRKLDEELRKVKELW